MIELWPQVLERLSNELPEQQVNTWLRPLQAVQEDGVLRLLAPNRFAVDWVQSNAAERIGSMLRDGPASGLRLVVELGSRERPGHAAPVEPARPAPSPSIRKPALMPD